MTTEEIEKAAGRYSGDELASGYPYVHPAHKQSIETRCEAFKAGAEFVNQHWQEKTRWIPVEERLPVFGGKVRTILVKTSDNLYSFLWVMQEISLLDFALQSYTHWKEIE